MTKLNELYEKYVNMSATELYYNARGTLEALLEYFTTLTRDPDDALTVIVSFAAASMSADGTFSKTEVAYCAELMHLDREHALSLLVKASRPERIAAAHGLYDACESKVQFLILNFCMCFIACDGSVHPSENKFIKSLIA